jgi:hypothetical protein
MQMLRIVIYCRGHHWKGIAIYNVAGIILHQKKQLFWWTKMFLERLLEYENNNLYNFIIFCFQKIMFTFPEVPF